MPVQFEGISQLFMDPVDDPDHLVTGFYGIQKDCEFVPSEPRHSIDLAHNIEQTEGHLLEKGVADTMPEGIVNNLEAVQIHIKQGKGVVEFPDGTRKGDIQPLHELDTVIKTG